MSEIATFGAGCFWGVEANFRRIAGVIEAISGYSGGHTENPTYRDVCTDTTGHAEVVQVTFDPAKVSYEQLLDAFWKMHDANAGESPGSGLRKAISHGRFLPFAGTRGSGKEGQAGLGSQRKIPQTYRHGNHASWTLLAR